MKTRIKECIDNLKHLPGVYLMHGENDKVIYVGKAKDLYKRVSQYFLRPQAGKVAKMAMEAEYFETIITANEKEAFVLEMNLIQTYYPKYNILLKDGSHYPYIALKKKGDPYLVIKRNKKDNNYVYYGPYPNSTAAYEMVSLLNKIFPIRKCKNLSNNTCLYYHLGQCLGPCINKIDDEINNKIKNDIKSFMHGNNNEQKSLIKAKMLEASEKLDFESANEYKKILDAIEHINTSQNVEIKEKKDIDIFAFTSRNGYIALALLIYRKGILLAKEVFTVEEFGEINEQIVDLIYQYYVNHQLPKQIVINNNEITNSLANLFGKTEIINVTRGHLHELVISASENAKNALDEYFISNNGKEDCLSLLEELGHLLNINTPLHIELFDNSHLQGSNPVGTMVAFINGQPCKKLYRKFKIESANSKDDLNSMKEVVFRHYSRVKEENAKLCDLILVDGSINQIKAAFIALTECNLEIPLFGLYKDNKHSTKGLVDIKGNVYPINNKNLFFLLTKMQDEVHRFAITYHISKRDKAMTVSILDDINGLGIKRKQMILRSFNDIDSLKKATIQELEQIVPNAVAINIYNKLHN